VRAHSFNHAFGLALGTDQSIYVTDSGGQYAVHRFRLKVTRETVGGLRAGIWIAAAGRSASPSIVINRLRRPRRAMAASTDSRPRVTK
jgi:hypothetical protein